MPIEAKGLPYTWMNKRSGDNFVMEKLDRVFGNMAWLDCYPHCLVRNLPIIASDHGPIVLDSDCIPPFRHRPFRFEWMWTTHPECPSIVKAAWQEGNHQGFHAFRVTQKVKAVKDTFKCWNKQSFGIIEKEIN